jgi:hypothetical protein
MYLYWKESNVEVEKNRHIDYAVFSLAILTLAVGIVIPIIFNSLYNLWGGLP